MAAIIELRDEIQVIIEDMEGVQYLRANPQHANTELMNNKMDDECLAIHIDQSTASGSRSYNHIIKIIPTEILFVYKNTSLDDKLPFIDQLVDRAEEKADEFYDKLIQSSVISDLGEFEDYECQRLEGYKRFDTILSGILFTWDAPVSRKQYYCAD